MKKLIFCLLFLSGCALESPTVSQSPAAPEVSAKPTSKLMNKLSIGMTKAQVIEALGEPDSTSAKGRQEYLRYSLTDQLTHSDGSITLVEMGYFVNLIAGKVESFGSAGDFDSDTLNLNIKKE
jgi:hypothetical protein